ncbi:PspC domain-containing protein [Flavobacterium sp. N1994]|uniref:PspC domain-containing protein n=1 Tax=Flavobacterium sp. N1994 TaxID=2986827 RepID=UPI002221A835|nr:PspC domain-containing protein [Flavobacterium sp. N1994]
MNKTVNINIGGLIFHIDEDAYQKLTRYFEAIKRSLSNSSGQDEIMKDIEMRVAELLSERQKSDKHVINNKDVDEVIVVMGQPEDYRIDDDEAKKTEEPFYPYTRTKKLYRDKDRGTIAGVCTGLGHYFGIDAVWLKILFLILFFGFGTGFIAYIILWIAMPKAVTTSEKLEMTGEPVTISNIEKKVREEFDSVTNKFKNADYDKMGNQVKTGAERVAGGIGEVFMKVFGAFAKVLGAFILIFSSFGLLGITIASIIMMFSSSLPSNTILNHINTPIGLETPLWTQGILFLLAFGIPFFFLLILGLKLLVTNFKSIGNIAKYSLLAIWIIAVGILISLGINEATQLAFDGKSVKKETINVNPKDTLQIKFVNNDFFSKNIDEHEDFVFTQDSTKHEVIYSNNIRFEIKATDKAAPYLQIEKIAKGKSYNEANARAEKIKYGYKIIGNQLLLDNYLLTEIASKYRDQHIELYLYLPKGTLFKVDKSVESFDESDNDYFNFHFSSDDYIYKVDNSQVKCLNCPSDENEYNDVEGGIDTEDINVSDENDTVKTVTVKINGKVVTETKQGKKGKLTVDQNGIIIKTN